MQNQIAWTSWRMEIWWGDAKIRNFEDFMDFGLQPLELRLLGLIPDEPKLLKPSDFGILHPQALRLTRDQYRDLYRQVSEDYEEWLAK